MTPFETSEHIIRVLQSFGHQAFLVGGSVRDLVLGREPKDFDVTTSATPEQVQAIFEKTLAVGAAFGVVIVVINDIQVEVATFRIDGEYSDVRRPDSVTFTRSAKEDVVRRDFTINGLLLCEALASPTELDESLRTRVMGNLAVLDYVGGLADLENKVIRAIGNPEERFTEDALRMLRAVRFAAQLGFEIESATFAAICKLAPTIRKVSRERVTAELIKLVTAPFPVKGLVPLVTSGLLQEILPDLYLKFDRTLRRFALNPTKDPIKGLAMFFVDATAGLYESIKSLRLSYDESAAVVGACGAVTTLQLNNTIAGQKKLARRPGFFTGVDLFEQNGGDAKTVAFFRALTPEEINPKPFLTGDDLVARGLQPGPEFGRLLGALEVEQLEGRVTTREEAEAFYERLTVH